MTTPLTEHRAAADASGPAVHRHAGTRRTLGSSFDPRRNSLNFLRLVLAGAVIVSHAIPLGGFGSEFILVNTTLGGVAVWSFFAISGFLIAGSAVRNNVGRYLWQRFLRIFPGFWVCLAVTAGFIAFIGWKVQGDPRGPSCGLRCYLVGPYGAGAYVYHDFWLRMNQYQIAGTPRHIPFPLAWDGSLWTLLYEFLCYLALAVLAVTRILRLRYVVAALALGLWLTEAATAKGLIAPRLSFDMTQMLILGPVFLTGTLLFLYRDRLPDSGWIALVCAAGYVAGLWWPLGGGTITGPMVLAPLLAYPLLWLGTHLPLHRVGARNDYSYGVYIYAFPVQQLLAVWGVQRLGYVPYLTLGIVGTIPFAVASWWLIERHALRLKKMELRALWTPRLWRLRPAPTDRAP